MISFPLSITFEKALVTLQEVIRRAVDGTVVPLFVDYSNQRVIIGGTTISASPATMEIATGDIKVVTSGKGIILSDPSGNFYRVNIDSAGRLQATLL